MTEKEYRQSEGISRSELWRLNPDNGGTPEKFKWFQEHPEPQTPALIFGAMVHKLLLEPETFEAEYAIAPNVDRRTKDGKAAYAAFLEASAGKQEISAADFEKASQMVGKCLSEPFVGKLLQGWREDAYRWVDPVTEELCKIRADCVTEVGEIPLIVDYKTTADASLEGFTRSALRYGYDFQAGMYCEGIERITGKTPRFLFIVQEKDAPFAVNVVEADPAFILRGKDKFRELLGIYHECKQTGNWYGYMGPEPVIHEMLLPAWAGGENKN
ncbi:MAG: PD-(D/E)XK nuclease-like domain-containing protein [Ruminococcus sp.]|nr:PD-(D/E)XK nuclease-like domain-containing protein [Ruminococcus sp.]